MTMKSTVFWGVMPCNQKILSTTKNIQYHKEITEQYNFVNINKL
jgi:hypothetical protein